MYVQLAKKEQLNRKQIEKFTIFHISSFVEEKMFLFYNKF